MPTSLRIVVAGALLVVGALPVAAPASALARGVVGQASGRAPKGPCGPTSRAGQAPWSTFGGGPEHLSDGAGIPGRGGMLNPRWASPALDGAIYGEPVVGGGCVYVATEDDSVYAINATTGALRWHVHLATPVTGGLPCGDIDPSGITGAPVLDAARGELWVVAAAYLGRRPGHELVGLRARDGHVLSRRQFALPGTDPAAEQQRSALQLDRGSVYIALGGLYGDCGRYLGAVVSIPERGGRPGYWHVPTANQAGIWEPGGPDVVADGDLLVADGNGAGSSGQHFDGSNAVYELTPGLAVASVFAPADWANLNSSDLDLGSTGPAVLSGGRVLEVGKSGLGYLLGIPRLGGVGGQLYEAQVCRNTGAWGADAVSASTVYVPCANGLTAVHVAGHSFSVRWVASGGGTGCALVAGGRIFEQTAGGTLQAFSPSDGRVLQTVSLASPVTHFPWLVAVGQFLYAASGTRVVALRGL